MSRIIICGPAGSGKSFLRDKFIKKGFRCSIPYTTRPARENEINGRDYFFIEEHEFDLLVRYNKFIEQNSYKGWKYGTLDDDDQVFIMTPEGIAQLSKHFKDESLIIYLNVPSEIRKLRLSKRSDQNDSLERRMEADLKQFELFTDYDIELSNNDFLIDYNISVA